MSRALEIVYASAPTDEVEFATLEFTHAAFPGGHIRLVRGYDDIEVMLEDGSTATFTASGMEVGRASNDNSGAQALEFAVDNVWGDVQNAVDDAHDAGGPIRMTYRTYLLSDLTGPAEKPKRMRVKEVRTQGGTANVTGSYQDAINTAWPRERYTAQNAPGLIYL